jgi:hypothetical protein
MDGSLQFEAISDLGFEEEEQKAEPLGSFRNAEHTGFWTVKVAN